MVISHLHFYPGYGQISITYVARLAHSKGLLKVPYVPVNAHFFHVNKNIYLAAKQLYEQNSFTYDAAGVCSVFDICPA